MSNRAYSVRVILTDKCPDSIEEILHGDGRSLGPTFDKILQEAIKYRGDFEDWEPTCCDYAFQTKEDAQKFIANVKRKFKEQVDVECVVKSAEETDSRGMRVFKPLPTKLEERIAALTPSKIHSLDVCIEILQNGDALVAPENSEIQAYRATFANLTCKVTNKTRSLPILMRSGKKLGDTIFKAYKTPEDHASGLKSAMAAGWSKSDIFYDSVINGILLNQINNETVNDKPCPEMFFACTTLVVVVSDYEGEQFIGWFFYNENLDEVMNFTSYRV